MEMIYIYRNIFFLNQHHSSYGSNFCRRNNERNKMSKMSEDSFDIYVKERLSKSRMFQFLQKSFMMVVKRNFRSISDASEGYLCEE